MTFILQMTPYDNSSVKIPEKSASISAPDINLASMVMFYMSNRSLVT